MSRLREIFSRRPEGMSRTIKWLFGFPLAYIFYIVFTIFVPSFGKSENALYLRSAAFELILTFCVLLVVKKFLNFPVKKYFTNSEFFRYNLLFSGIFYMFTGGVLTSFIWMLFDPSNFSFSFVSSQVFPNWIFSLLLVLCAATAEEVVFRMYIGHFVNDDLPSSNKSVVIHCLISGFFFAIAHFENPEAMGKAMFGTMSFYFMIGAALMYFSLKTKGFEFAIGVHIGNNLVPAFVFGYNNSVIKTNTLFSIKNNIWWVNIIQVVVCLAICTIPIRKFLKAGSNV